MQLFWRRTVFLCPFTNVFKTRKPPFCREAPTLGWLNGIDAASIAVQEDTGPVRGVND